MDAMPWFAWIAIAGILSIAITAIVTSLTETRKKDRGALHDALSANTAAQQDTAARLDAIEQRLTTIEKTLTDIP